MNAIKVVIITNDQTAGFDVKSKITDENIAVVGFCALDERGVEKVLSLYPHVAIIIGTDREKPFEIAKSIYAKLPFCITYLISDKINVDIMEKAMGSGLRKVFSIEEESSVLKQSIISGYEQENARNSNIGIAKTPCLSRVISVFGGKGGIGKTTIAVNVALHLAQTGKKVMIIDSDLQMGDVHLLLNLEPKETLGELIYEGSINTIETIKSFTANHASGLSLIPSPKTPEYADAVEAHHLETIINTLRPFYDYIFIDLPPVFDDRTLACIENSDKIIMITGVDISSVRATKISINILENLRQQEKVIIVLNKVTKSIISEKDIERVLQRKINYKVVENGSVALQCVNKGNPIVNMFPNTPIAKQLKNIADGI